MTDQRRAWMFPMRVEWLDAQMNVISVIERFGIDDAYLVEVTSQARYTRITIPDGRSKIGPVMTGELFGVRYE